MSDELLVLIASPVLEESLIDWLLEQDRVAGFSTAVLYGHSGDPQALSVAEQVTGRQRRVQFQIHIAAAAVEALLDELKREFGGSGLHYWRIPLRDAGHLTGQPEN